MNKLKKLDVKYYILAFIETFSIWQMGIIFYSSKTLTVNNLVNTPVILDNSILIVFMGYIIGILCIYLFPRKTILLGRISMILSLISTVMLFLPIPTTIFKVLYYITTFNCVYFISINTSLIINYYSLKTALIDAIMGTIVASLFIAICQNSIIPLSFNAFNCVSLICISLITFGLFKLPIKTNIKLLSKNEKIGLPPKKMIIGLILVQTITCLLTLFVASIAEPVKGGVSISYIGGFVSGILFLILYKKAKISPFKITKYYFAITSIGFLLYLLPINNLVYLALFLQGFNFFIIMLAPFLISHLFQIYPSKIIAPITVLIALLTVAISSFIIEVFRNNTTILYTIYVFISIFAIVIYLLIYDNLELQYYSKEYKFDKLTKREKEVANLIVKGFSVNEIAKTLFLSTHTVKDHTKSIYRKYEVHSKYELIQKNNTK